MFFLKLTYLFKHILLTDTKFALRAKKKKLIKRQQNKEDIKQVLAGEKYIFRYFYKILSIQI